MKKPRASGLFLWIYCICIFISRRQFSWTWHRVWAPVIATARNCGDASLVQQGHESLRSQRRCQFSDPSAIAANPKKSPVTYQATGLFLKRQDFLEEREGFEPSEPYGSPDFESGTFDHSATSPVSIADSSRLESRFRLLVAKELPCRPCRAATPPEYRHCRRRAGSFQARPPACAPRPGLSR